jgi:hypothetical protein
VSRRCGGVGFGRCGRRTGVGGGDDDIGAVAVVGEEVDVWKTPFWKP